jgi:hypothetical protein
MFEGEGVAEFGIIGTEPELFTNKQVKQYLDFKTKSKLLSPD